MRIRFRPLSEMTTTAAASPALPQVALGQRPSNAYRRRRKNRFDEGIDDDDYKPVDRKKAAKFAKNDHDFQRGIFNLIAMDNRRAEFNKTATPHEKQRAYFTRKSEQNREAELKKKVERFVDNKTASRVKAHSVKRDGNVLKTPRAKFQKGAGYDPSADTLERQKRAAERRTNKPKTPGKVVQFKPVTEAVIIESREFVDKLGIKPEKADPSHSVNTIGYSESKKKWYGWSHRAYAGFGVGSTVKKGDVLAARYDVGYTAKSMDDAKKMAIAFADEVG